ncbi:hypothetical protein ACIGXM_29890 [Kitasatospora sp. NPDC052896]|uniref:hypothetical protein n=1 Tax=Kitasatospora sp. NPDC052896 TaxID=3364061 RepID=UPI0037C76642
MLIETGVDLVRFLCPCGQQWSRRYELRHCEAPSGEMREYFRLDGAWVLPPYGPDGAEPCGGCARPVIGRLESRRLTDPSSPARSADLPPWSA